MHHCDLLNKLLGCEKLTDCIAIWLDCYFKMPTEKTVFGISIWWKESPAMASGKFGEANLTGNCITGLTPVSGIIQRPYQCGRIW